MASKNRKTTAIHWFRKGLRIHDNPALIEAITYSQKNNCYFRPIFILDPKIKTWMQVGVNRWRFLQQSLVDLDKQLRTIQSRLYVVRGIPDDVFPKIFENWNVELLTFETDTEPFAVKRDESVKLIAKKHNVNIIEKVSNTIYDVNLVLVKNNGAPPLTYQKFLSIVEKLKVADPLPSPTEELPSDCQPLPDENETENIDCYNPPTLTELLGELESTLGECKYPGGETESLKRLEIYMKKKNWVCNFEKPKTAPNSIEPSTTVLSPYIKFGCLSSRLFYKRLQSTVSNSKHTKPPVSLIGQLLWREFYYTAGYATPNFDKMAGNKICCQIPWDTNDEYLQAWKFGKTGYPFIDAIMRQLRQEGWIHHLARHAVACFLTRGDLWISWEEGQKVFEEYLLDADWSLNAGNWMWLSASAFFHQFFRVYSPVAFGKKTDKNGDYIKKYVPELKKYPINYIYEPWNASLAVQKAAGCIIGKDYPLRIVIHEDVHKKNIAKMSAAYKQNKMMNEKMASNLKRPSESKSEGKTKKSK